MSARSLPERPHLDQLKRQAKDLLKAWRLDPARAVQTPSSQPPRLREAQRAIAEQYGFASWDALRAHVEQLADRADADSRRRRGMQYDDPVPDAIPLTEPVTRESAARLAERGVSGVKVSDTVPRDGLVHLARIDTLRRLDLSNRDDLADDDLAFLQAMPWLTAISLARCGGISDRGVAYLRDHQQLEQVNLQWTATGDDAIAALTGKPELSRVLVGNRMTDTGAARLREFPALAVAGAADSFLSVSSARALTDVALASIGELKGIAALDVHMSVFGSPHYTARGVAHLRGMASLEQLNFHGQLATDAVLAEIAGIPRLRHLHCQDIASGDDGFIELSARDTLEELTGRVCPRVTDRGFAAIARLSRLRSLGAGGPRLTAAALAPFVETATLEDLGPILFGDDAFVFIGRLPRLQRLTNMYNRATTDAATRHLRDHPRLSQYSAFGTQITDESLEILAGLPVLERLGFENCADITDTGLRALARASRLRRVRVWSCVRVTGAWLEAMPSTVEATSEGSTRNQIEGYRAETLQDYPDLPMPDQAKRPSGDPMSAVGTFARTGLLSRLACFGVDAEFVADGLQVTVPAGADARWIALVTREVFAVPLRIEIEIKPITALRLTFGGHNRGIVLDAQGCVIDPMPWFLKTTAWRGQPHGDGDADAVHTFTDGEWARVAVEIDDRERRLFVNDGLRHTWPGDFAGLRGRIGIGVQRSELTIRDLSVSVLAR
jgi:hypothetical protein